MGIGGVYWHRWREDHPHLNPLPSRERRPERAAVGSGLADCLDFEADAFVLLNVADDLEQVAGLGVARRSEHSHEALGLFAGEGCELLESDGGVDVVAQEDLAGVGVSG